MDMPSELDPNVERFISGQDRLKIVRLDTYVGSGLGADGLPYLKITTAGGSSSVFAFGIPLAELAAAADAFNTRLATGRLPDEEDPVTARRRRHAVAAAVGDRVREMIDAEALSLR